MGACISSISKKKASSQSSKGKKGYKDTPIIENQNAEQVTPLENLENNANDALAKDDDNKNTKDEQVKIPDPAVAAAEICCNLKADADIVESDLSPETNGIVNVKEKTKLIDDRIGAKSDVNDSLFLEN